MVNGEPCGSQIGPQLNGLPLSQPQFRTGFVAMRRGM